MRLTESADRLKAARKKANMTQQQLADKLGVSAQMISAWETGRRNPKYSTMKEIAKALGAPAMELLPELNTGCGPAKGGKGMDGPLKVCPRLVQSETYPAMTPSGKDTCTRTYMSECLGNECAACREGICVIFGTDVRYSPEVTEL
jgi:DNA-binding XRE family transcriptional regulator